MPGRLVPAAVAVVLIFLSLCAAGCRPGYVTRVGIQHLRFMSRARPIPELIEQETDAVRRRRLELVLDARDFAARSGLDVGGSYEKVSDTTGLSTAYVVTAAYRDRLEPYQWSYPVVGRIPYRGYFEREAAEKFGARLGAKGYDVHVVEAGAYSTLGWFDDPLPSGVLDYDDVALVDLVLHELVHRTVYVPGDIALNETLASAVAARLTVAFFAGRGETGPAVTAGERRERWLAQGRYMDALAAELSTYLEQASAGGGGADALLTGRREIYAAALARMAELALVPADAGADLADRLNNAVFLALWRYRKRVDVVDGYLEHARDIGAALAALPSVVDGADDPYAALQSAASAAAPASNCCSERPAVFCLSASQQRGVETPTVDRAQIASGGTASTS